jgi:hypothetical protein
MRAGMIVIGLSAFIATMQATAASAWVPDAGLDLRVARIEAELDAQEAVREIKRLQQAFSHYANAGQWHDMGELFTRNVQAEIGSQQLSGRDAVRTYYQRRAGGRSSGLPADRLNEHLLLQPIIALDADGRGARGTWHEVALLGQWQHSARWEGGIYENEYRREDGAWLISRLRYFPQYAGNYEDWGHKAPARWDVPYHFDAAHVGVTIPAALLQGVTPATSAAATPRRLAHLQRRIARLQDETAVRNLQHSFGYYLDRKLWDDVADLFSADGEFGEGARAAHVGRDDIQRALVAKYGGAALQSGELFDHVMLGTVANVSADGSRANVRSLQIGMIGRAGVYARWELGAWQNEYVKEQGLWRLRRAHFIPRVVTDYDAGWAYSALPPGAYPDSPVVKAALAAPRPGKSPGATRSDSTPDGLMQVAMLEQALENEIGVDAVENLNSSYGYYIDESAWDSMADTFARTAGAKEITGAGVYVGRDRIRHILNLRGPRGGRTPDFFTIHQLTQPVIHVASDGRSAKARLRLFQSGGSANGSSGSWIGGIYENTAVFEDGEWKFGVQDLHHLFNVSYRNGWGRAGGTALPVSTSAPGSAGRDGQGGGIRQGLGGAAQPSRFSTEFPPDHAIRAGQYAFPQITEPAFHYVNPASGRAPATLLP